MRELSKKVLADERVRFLAVGGFNTAFGYLIFVLADLSVGRMIRDDGSAV